MVDQGGTIWKKFDLSSSWAFVLPSARILLFIPKGQDLYEMPESGRSDVLVRYWTTGQNSEWVEQFRRRREI